MARPAVCIVVALGRNRELGKGNQLLWRIPDDLRRFKALTMGHPLIFGRKTFESIGKPLAGRTTIVITRDKTWSSKGVVVTHSLEEALTKAGELDSEEIHIGGGAQLYKEALPRVDKLYLTRIDGEKEADTFFPAYEDAFRIVKEEEREWEGLSYSWVDLERS